MKKAPLLFDQQYKEESKLLETVTEWLNYQPDLKALRICDRYAKGYSDIFVCLNGQFVVIELKDDTGTMSKHQEEFIKDMKAVGAIGAECRTLRQVINLIEEARHRSNSGWYKDG